MFVLVSKNSYSLSDKNPHTFTHAKKKEETLFFSSVLFACLLARQRKIYSGLMIAALFDLSDHPKATFDPLPPGVGLRVKELQSTITTLLNKKPVV